MRDYILSLPERVVRSATALAAGLLNEIGETALPAALRRTRLYQSVVEMTLRFLLEQIGEVEGVFPTEQALAENFLLRRAAGNGIDLLGFLTLRASPVWVLAVLADLSGAGRTLIVEISASLREEGLLPPDSRPGTMDQFLDALEQTAGRASDAIHTPPLDIAGMRREWAELQRSAAGLLPESLPKPAELERSWHDLQSTAEREQRGVFALSAMMALDAITSLPRGVAWMGRSSLVAARATGEVVAERILEHYSDTLEAVRTEGLVHWWRLRFRPYLAAAARQFSPQKSSWTQRLLRRR